MVRADGCQEGFSENGFDFNNATRALCRALNGPGVHNGSSSGLSVWGD
jgi:hypothetical protein